MTTWMKEIKAEIWKGANDTNWKRENTRRKERMKKILKEEKRKKRIWKWKTGNLFRKTIEKGDERIKEERKYKRGRKGENEERMKKREWRKKESIKEKGWKWREVWMKKEGSMKAINNEGIEERKKVLKKENKQRRKVQQR